MAEVVSAKVVCPLAKSLHISDASPLNRSSFSRGPPDSLKFQNSVASRPALPPSQRCCYTRRCNLQVNAATLYPTSMTWWKKGNLPNMQDINSAQEFVDAMTKAGDRLVLVDFYSVGCRSCKALYPKICQIAADNPNLVVLKVNFHENIALCRSLNVSMLPFFHIYRGKEGRIDAFSCSLTKINKLRAAVSKHSSGHFVLPVPGPVIPVVNRMDLLSMGSRSLTAAASLA